MPKRSRKPTKDINETAFSVVQQIISGQLKPEKNPHAQALGKLGGLRGGKRRAELLSDERKREIAKGAAIARWKKQKQK